MADQQQQQRPDTQEPKDRQLRAAILPFFAAGAAAFWKIVGAVKAGVAIASASAAVAATSVATAVSLPILATGAAVTATTVGSVMTIRRINRDKQTQQITVKMQEGWEDRVAAYEAKWGINWRTKYNNL